ncbi:hypothetical protein HMPREF0591_6215 [Mycobacterium parascrofulaceum ATCC BAA-614]|uniref:Uncharacterized protein n=1 Tax=Mycobacterium parascrofulaceum ATCC BAA-614 TaxID=525368 RepID=D5PJ71_9MYCO|nr:hypothetical protein HMPREF0591_6215 [Mycobacterium parascrofulaceum ATCC BAA-614]
MQKMPRRSLVTVSAAGAGQRKPLGQFPDGRSKAAQAVGPAWEKYYP